MKARHRANCIVSFQRFDNSVRNALNEVVGGYAEIYRAKAYRYDLSEREKELAGRSGCQRASKFILRVCDEVMAVNLADRIVSDGISWDIAGFRDLPDAGRGRVEFTAIADLGEVVQ